MAVVPSQSSALLTRRIDSQSPVSPAERPIPRAFQGPPCNRCLRLRSRFLSAKGWGIVAPKELTPFAEIVVKADDFRAVYEQRLLDDKGEETVVVTADGFDANGIPREKKWVRRRPDGQHETTTYAILDAKVNIDIPDSEFEFHPPEGYLVTVMGPDGKPIRADAPPAPTLEKKPAGNRLCTLSVLAVLALAAFTLRKLWLRRRANAAR